MANFERRNEYRIAWGQICLNSYRQLWRSARRFARGSADDAEDLVQETVMRVLKYPKDPKTIQNPNNYLVRMMRNIWHDKWWKQSARIISLDDSENVEELEPQLPIVLPDAFVILENFELIAKLESAAATLSERERHLLMSHLQGLSTSEIAEALDDDVKVIRMDLNAVLAKIRYRLQKASSEFGTVKLKPPKT